MGHTKTRLAPSWRRLCNEYYPRLMVMLSVTNDVRTRERNVIITEDTIRRARTLVFWFFSHAERILSGILEGEGNARLIEKAMRRMFCIVRDHGGKERQFHRHKLPYLTRRSTPTGGPLNFRTSAEPVPANVISRRVTLPASASNE